MRPSLIHQFLGIAGIVVRLDAHSRRLDFHGRRLARQERLMSKATASILALAAGLTTLSTAQAKEALEQKELSERFTAFVNGKQPGDEITQDELDQLAGFATAVGTAADSANQRADELKTMVDQLPDPDPTTGGDDSSTPAEPTGNGEGSSSSTTTTEPVSDPSAPSDSSPSEPASDPSSEPLA